MPDRITSHLFGKKANLETAISSGEANEFDEVFLTDTDELVYINENKEVKYITQRTKEEYEVPEGGLGKLNAGDTIPAGTSFDTVLKAIMLGIGTPTYSAPECNLHNTGTESGTYETGTMITPVIGADFTQNDAGAFEKLEILKDGEVIEEDPDAVYTGDDLASYTYSPEAISLPDNGLTFNAKIHYAEGAIRENIFGNPIADGHIEAGSITGTDIAYVAARKTFWSSTTVDQAISFTSESIRAFEGSELGIENGDKVLSFSKDSKYIAIAMPATKKLTAVHSDQVASLTVGSFTTSTVQVADARGGDNGLVDYTCYLYNIGADTPQEDVTITLTIGDAD